MFEKGFRRPRSHPRKYVWFKHDTKQHPFHQESKKTYKIVGFGDILLGSFGYLLFFDPQLIVKSARTYRSWLAQRPCQTMIYRAPSGAQQDFFFLNGEGFGGSTFIKIDKLFLQQKGNATKQIGFLNGSIAISLKICGTQHAFYCMQLVAKPVPGIYFSIVGHVTNVNFKSALIRIKTSINNKIDIFFSKQKTLHICANC